MNVVVIIVQVVLALHTLMGAAWKLKNPAQTVPALKVIPHPAWIGISVVEIFCVIGLIVPLFVAGTAILASTSAAIIGLIMVLYIILQLASGQKGHGEVIYWGVVALVCAFVAFARLMMVS